MKLRCQQGRVLRRLWGSPGLPAFAASAGCPYSSAHRSPSPSEWPAAGWALLTSDTLTFSSAWLLFHIRESLWVHGGHLYTPRRTPCFKAFRWAALAPSLSWLPFACSVTRWHSWGLELGCLGGTWRDRYLARQSVAHFKLIFVRCVRQRPTFTFLYVDIQLYQRYLLKILLAFIWPTFYLKTI